MILCEQFSNFFNFFYCGQRERGGREKRVKKKEKFGLDTDYI